MLTGSQKTKVAKIKKILLGIFIQGGVNIDQDSKENPAN